MYRGVLAAAAAVFACAPASAAIHQYSFVGTLVDDPSSTISGYLGYDDAAAPVGTQGSNITYYNALTHFSGQGDGFAFVALTPAFSLDGDTAVGDGTIGGINDVIGFFADRFQSSSGITNPVDLVLVDPTNSTWTGTALPTSLLSPTFTRRQVMTSVNGRSVAYDINLVAVDSIPTVPEPASWAMMIAGFGLVGAAARLPRVGAQRQAYKPS